MESQINMDTIRINIKYIMLGMITTGTADIMGMIIADIMGMTTADIMGMITAGTVGTEGMPTIITEALRNFS